MFLCLRIYHLNLNFYASESTIYLKSQRGWVGEVVMPPPPHPTPHPPPLQHFKATFYIFVCAHTI